ncbi:dihydroneopterin aldolase [Spirillospora sp. NPDC048911]|uniref:dihydroneopterin aldolase n=1 Tax=Spirillospora sp. NPDC048911 TaxID=3364527 RepID=UPI00371CE8C7
MVLVTISRRREWRLSEGSMPVRRARRLTEQTLTWWQLPEVGEHAGLVVSELVTNAFRHGAPPVELALSLVLDPTRVTEVALQVDVRDGASTMPVCRQGSEAGGFGLTVASRLAELSYHPRRIGKVVRAVVPLAGSERPHLVQPTSPCRSAADGPHGNAQASPLIDSPEGKTYVDLIEIEALRLRCIIGCDEEERRDRSDVVIHLEIGTDVRPAAQSDDLADAWNYRTGVKAIISHVERSQYRTVEALATEVARILVVDHRAPYVRVRLHKPGALRFADAVGAVIERTTADFSGPLNGGDLS